MYNAASRLHPILIATAVLFASCGNNSKNQAEAEKLVSEADSAINVGNYALAIERIDSLKNTYPKQIEAQRKGMHLRPRAIEGQTLLELQATDSLQSYYTYVQDSLMQYFTFVDNPDLVEGYYVATEYANAILFDRSGLESRVSPDGQFYIISSHNSYPVHHTSITLSDRNAEASTPSVRYDGERNYRSGNNEMITFTESECDTLALFVINSTAHKINLTYKGIKDRTIELPANDRISIQRAYLLSTAMKEKKRLAAQREFLDKQLLLARDQAARTSAAGNEAE